MVNYGKPAYIGRRFFRAGRGFTTRSPPRCGHVVGPEALALDQALQPRKVVYTPGQNQDMGWLHVLLLICVPLTRGTNSDYGWVLTHYVPAYATMWRSDSCQVHLGLGTVDDLAVCQHGRGICCVALDLS